MPKKLSPSRVPELIALLESRYGGVTTALAHENAFQLLVATILSAQTTDKLVNLVTPALFARFPDARSLAAADLGEVEKLVGRVNFYRNKSKNLVAMAKALVEKHGGEVPRTMEELVALPGVARKTGNVVLGSAFGIPSGVVVDTHVARVSQLLGLTTQSDPVKIEQDLMKVVPKDKWVLFAHMLIHHGREVCIARRPQCDVCVVNTVCVSAFKAPGYVGERAAARAERGTAKKEKAIRSPRFGAKKPAKPAARAAKPSRRKPAASKATRKKR